MAAGEGRRLRPVTERYAKPVLPIDGRPVIAVLLHELVAAGVERITVVTGHLAEQVERLLDGFPADLRFVRQPSADGSADAVRCAALVPPYLVLGADTLFTRGDVGRFAVAAVRIEHGLVTRVLDDDPANPLGGAPLWLFGERVHSHLGSLPGPPFENATAVQRAIDEGARVAGVEIGPTRDLTDPLDLVIENFGYLKDL
jgi:CTP:molybdopterin cytidylyltransferase MocA